MSEPTITCPNCKTAVKLTESLAAPLIESTRLQFQQQLEQKDREVANREDALRIKETQLQDSKAKLDEQVANQVEAMLKKERSVIATDEARKAKLALGDALERKAQEVSELTDILKAREEKLAEAQNAQAELVKQKRELDDAKREMSLTIEKRIQDGLQQSREKIQREAEETYGLRVMEKEQTILAMQKQIEDLKRKAEQGSQQLQGEVQELALESMLQTKFPFDLIEPVPKGEFGGDILQRVVGPGAQVCGTILWESKRTKNWSDSWLAKLREDQRNARAEIAVIVSQTLPAGIETFEQVGGIWITHPRAAFPVAMVLRQTLLEISTARMSLEGQQTKTEMVYQYLTGPRFRQRVEAIVEAFSSMQSDLDKERKVIMKQWAKRSEQIERVMQATVGMYGDLQGIAGKSLQEIEGLELLALSSELETE